MATTRADVSPWRALALLQSASRPDVEHKVEINLDTKDLRCSCEAFRFSRGMRTCKHVRFVERQLQDEYGQAREQGSLAPAARAAAKVAAQLNTPAAGADSRIFDAMRERTKGTQAYFDVVRLALASAGILVSYDKVVKLTHELRAHPTTLANETTLSVAEVAMGRAPRRIVFEEE